MSTARRVLMVVEGPFPVTRGGAEVQVRLLGAQLVRLGVDVVTVAPLVPRGRQTQDDRIDGVPVVRIPYPRVRVLGGAVMLGRLALFLLGQRSKAVAIHAHIAGSMAAVCCLVGRLLGKRVIVKASGAHELKTGVLAPGWRGSLVAALRWAISKATYYQAISQELARSFSRSGFDSSRVRIIPNAVDTERFRPQEGRDGPRQTLGVSDKLVGVFVGRLEPEKNLEGLFRAWAEAFPPEAGTALLVVGTGSLEERLKALVGEIGRGSQILFYGATPDVEGFLAAADFAVLPSVVEGLSNSLLEYMAAGLPVLGSRVSGTEDLVRTGHNGWLCDTASPLAPVLREVAATPRRVLRQMGEAARRDVCDYAGVDSVLGRLLELYGLERPLGAEG